MLQLIIGNKRYSSWSMRPWMLMREFQIPFEETLVPLYQDETQQALLAHSPAGKVPILRDGEVTVWESLAIIDYVAELYPELPIWPRERVARAHARSLACEMHAGFAALRAECSVNFGRPRHALSLTEAARADVRRLDDAWLGALTRFGGRFLFGQFCAVDAMFAPIAQRLDNYVIPVSDEARGYIEEVKSLPSWEEWGDAARREEWRLPQFERD